MKIYFNTLGVRIAAVLLGTIGTMGQINAQVTYSEDYNFGTPTDTTRYVTGYNPSDAPPDCKAPNVNLSSVINYSTKSAAKLHFVSNGLQLNNVRLSIKGDASVSFPVAISGDVAFINNLQPNTSYQVTGMNSCGKQIVITEFNTYQYRPGADGIRVSDKLYRHLSTYLLNRTGALPLHDYVNNLRDIDTYEKSDFLQKFFLRGAKLPDGFIGIVPMDYIRTYLNGGDPDPGNDGGDDIPCVCEFVLNQSAYAVPDAIEQNQSLDRVVFNDDGEWDTSRWWLETKEAGPAKYQKLSTDGWKENLGVTNGKIFERGASMGGQPKSPNYATISYTFLCVNFPAATPEECGCDKKISVRAEYTSKLDVRATVRSGGGGKKSATGFAQDFAVLLTTRTNAGGLGDVQIVDAGSNIAIAQCDGGVNTSDLINSASQIVGSVAGAIVAVKTGNIGDIGNAASDLLSKIAGPFKLFEEEKSCTSFLKEETLVQRTSSITLKPNDPVSVVLLSGSRLESKGKRSWDSRAQVNSDFFLTGVLLGSNSAPGETHCCTDYSAQWVYATENRIPTSLTIPVNAHIFGAANGAGSISINGVPTSSTNYSSGSEIGHATANFLGCEKKVPIFNFR